MRFKHAFHVLQATLGETLSLFASLLLYLFPDRPLDKPLPGPGVLLVHGYLHNTSPWRWFRRALHKRGVGSVNSVYYPSLLVDIPTASLSLKERIQALEKEGEPVEVLIGHSEGGLVALEYALEQAPKGRNITVIALGAPLNGTRMAKLPLGPGPKQMQINSPYLHNLKKRLQSAYHIRFLAISSSLDNVVRPTQNAIWPEFPHQTFDNLGHVQLLFSPKVVDACVHFLKQG